MKAYVHSELEDELDNMPDDLTRWYILHCIDRMIEFEKVALGLDYFVFYRVVGKKYILYQINTILLEFAGLYDGDLICAVPSLDEAEYPDSVSDLMNWFETNRVQSDMQCTDFLLSVNCTLFPAGKNAEFYKKHHLREASPLFFFNEYDGSLLQYRRGMEKIFRRCEIPEEQANELCNTIESLYLEKMSQRYDDGSEGFNGHCLQICVPASALHGYVYPSVYYGTPITLHHHRRKKGQYEAHDRFPESSRPQSLPPAARFEEVIFSPDACHMQSRIIGHPNLFIKHGAVTNVFHGEYKFDTDGFRNELRELLRPHYKPEFKLNFSKFQLLS